MILTKEQVTEYEKIVYDARAESPVVAFTDLIKHHMERVKGELVEANSDSFQLLQGEARAYVRLLKSLKAPRGTTL